MNNQLESMGAWPRILRCKALGVDITSALQIARSNYGPNSLPARIIEKAAALDTDAFQNDPDLRAASRGFLELVQASSLLGKISGFCRVPFETNILKQKTPLEASWIAEGRPMPITLTSFEATKLTFRRIGAIIPVTDDVLKGAGAAFENALSRQLTSAVSELENTSFTDPANAGEEGVTPASITHGVTPIGGTEVPSDDVNELLDGFTGDLERSVLVTSPRAGKALHDAGFDSTGIKGGDVAGLTHITSTDVPDSRVILLDPTGIMLSDEGAIFDLSTQTTLQLTDSEGQPAESISLWQLNLSAIKITRHLNWQDLRGGSVAFINDAQWV